VAATNLVRFRAAIEGALAQLESRREEVNDLNVFPVADGDTGDNMVLTLKAVLTELDRLSGDLGVLTVDEIGREEIVDSVARAALLGARGNSGVILSQLIRGAAEELVSRPGELVDPVLVGRPWPGRPTARMRPSASPRRGRSSRSCARWRTGWPPTWPTCPIPGSAPTRRPTCRTRRSPRSWSAPSTTGQESVKRGPELLPVLREAGVVDAGGYALTIIFAGVVAALRGAEAPELEHHAPARVTHPQHESSTYRYCTNFAVTGDDLDDTRFIRELEKLGDSVLVVGDRTTLKVHVHTDEPSARPACSRGPGRCRASTWPTCASRSASARSAWPPATAASRRRRARWPWSRERACGRCSRVSACTPSTAARR
jgi:hypothetical protein